MANHVYAKQTTIVVVGGDKVRLYEGEVWAGDDPVVRAHPSNFASEPTKLRRTAPAPVEEATAAPGAKRTTTRKGSAGAA